MKLGERMVEIRNSQEKLLKELEAVIREYESTDLVREHEELKQEYEQIKIEYHQLKQLHEKTIQENSNLRTVLHEQILDEKLSILKVSKVKLQTYFSDQSDKHRHKLETVEIKAKKQIESLKEKAEKYLGEEKEKFFDELQQLESGLDDKIRIHREQLAVEEEKLLNGINRDISELSSESVSEETIQKRIKQNEIEMKIGLNWVNKIGIILILLGVGAAAKYSYATWFNDYMKGIFFFLLGGVLLIGGEWSYRKEKQTFAIGLLGGGISVLYGAIFYSYFLLKIINLPTGLLLSVAVTLSTIILSLRYQSKTICALGLIGGYFPFFSYIFAYGLNGNYYYAAMGYLFLLNLSVLLISLQKKWNMVNYISFLFHFPSLVYLVWNAPSENISMGYSLLTFFMYLGITLTYPFKKQQSLNRLDVILLAMNTFFSFAILYFLFESAGYEQYHGLLALVFAIIYIGLGQFVEKVMSGERQTKILFYSASLTFAILMIPFQFGVQWLSMGWFVEGIILLLYGYRIKFKPMERVGWGLFLASIFVFYLMDFLQMAELFASIRYFDFKYAVITSGMGLVIYFYLWEMSKNKEYRNGMPFNFVMYFKYWTLLHLWAYFLYSGVKLYDHWVPVQYTHFEFYKWIVVASITIGMGYGLSKIRLIQDRIVIYYRMFLNIIGDLILLYIVAFIPALHPVYTNNTFYDILALVILTGFNLYVFFSVRDFILSLIRRSYRNMEFYPVIIGLYFMGVITAFLIVQFRLGDVNLLFSIVYLLMAISYILYGFIRRYVYIRRMGLALSLLSTSKLFLFDLSFLQQGSKIFAYFSFGVLLLAISFIYQKISQRMTEFKRAEDTNIAKKI